jgi:hypothetical protein
MLVALTTCLKNNYNEVQILTKITMLSRFIYVLCSIVVGFSLARFYIYVSVMDWGLLSSFKPNIFKILPPKTLDSLSVESLLDTQLLNQKSIAIYNGDLYSNLNDMLLTNNNLQILPDDLKTLPDTCRSLQEKIQDADLLRRNLVKFIILDQKDVLKSIKF